MTAETVNFNYYEILNRMVDVIDKALSIIITFRTDKELDSIEHSLVSEFYYNLKYNVHVTDLIHLSVRRSLCCCCFLISIIRKYLSEKRQ